MSIGVDPTECTEQATGHREPVYGVGDVLVVLAYQMGRYRLLNRILVQCNERTNL